MVDRIVIGLSVQLSIDRNSKLREAFSHRLPLPHFFIMNFSSYLYAILYDALAQRFDKGCESSYCRFRYHKIALISLSVGGGICTGRECSRDFR